jgi:hypothetical protein
MSGEEMVSLDVGHVRIMLKPFLSAFGLMGRLLFFDVAEGQK